MQTRQAPLQNGWIRASGVTYSELESLAHAYDLDINILHDVLDKHELPRVEIIDNTRYVFIRSGTKDKHGQLVTIPALLITKKSLFFHISLGDIGDISSIAPQKALTHTATPDALLLSAIASALVEYEELMRRTSRYIKDTKGRLRSHEVVNKDFVRFVTVEDNLNEYKVNLDGMLTIVQRLKDSVKNNADKEALEDIILFVHQLIVAVESYNNSVASIRNAYSTIANNTLNHRMKVLTILTLLIALPNVFYGMYGMNIALPYQDQPWAYPAITLFTFVVILAAIFIARKKNIF